MPRTIYRGLTRESLGWFVDHGLQLPPVDADPEMQSLGRGLYCSFERGIAEDFSDDPIKIVLELELSDDAVVVESAVLPTNPAYDLGENVRIYVVNALGAHACHVRGDKPWREDGTPWDEICVYDLSKVVARRLHVDIPDPRIPVVATMTTEVP